jgi:hypothetical protein
LGGLTRGKSEQVNVSLLLISREADVVWAFIVMAVLTLTTTLYEVVIVIVVDVGCCLLLFLAGFVSSRARGEKIIKTLGCARCEIVGTHST